MIAAQSHRRPLGRTGKILLALGAFAVSLLLAELGLRLLFAIQGRPYSAVLVERLIRNVVSSVQDRVPLWDGRSVVPQDPDEDDSTRTILHPYLGFDAWYMTDALTKEVEYFRLPAAEQMYDVIVLGGSVAAGFAAHGSEELIAVMQRDPRFASRPIRVINQARGAFKQPQQVAALSFALSAGYEPDAVIEIDGFNEVAVGNHNAATGVHPLYPSGSNWLVLAQGGAPDREALDRLIELREVQTSMRHLGQSALDLGLQHSALAGTIGLRLLTRWRRESNQIIEGITKHLADSRELQAHGPAFNRGKNVVSAMCAKAWMEGSLSLHAMCKQRGIAYLHVLQPSLHDAGSKPLTEDEVEKGRTFEEWHRGVEIGYPRLRAGGERLRAAGVAFCDASQVFAEVKESLYFDACHFTVEGHRILARTVASALLALDGETKSASADGEGTDGEHLDR